jgi:hypothetical protein
MVPFDFFRVANDASESRTPNCRNTGIFDEYLTGGAPGVSQAMRISPQGLPGVQGARAHLYTVQPPCQRDAQGHVNPIEIVKAEDLSEISEVAG